VSAAVSNAVLIRIWEHGSAPQRTAAAILRQISTGRLTRWSELPPVCQIAEDNDVSRATVARAKQCLARHGALVKEHGRYYVA
jgi:DNA-binding GntR family transcriptional regulator